jgi:AcrR family transcriptional regulator
MPHADSARDAILDRAVQVASVQGLNGLTIGMLASAVRMSKGGICAHFRSKKDLQLATAERATTLFRDAVIAPVLGKRRGLPRLRALGDAWLGYVDSGTFAGGCFFTNAALELDDAAASDEVGEYVRTQYARYLDFIELCAREAVEAEQLRRDVEPRRLALELHGIMAAALLWRAIGRDDALSTARTALADLLARAAA